MDLAWVAALDDHHCALGADVHAGHGQHPGRAFALHLALEQPFQADAVLLAETAVQLLAAFAADQQHVAPFRLDAAHVSAHPVISLIAP